MIPSSSKGRLPRYDAAAQRACGSRQK